MTQTEIKAVMDDVSVGDVLLMGVVCGGERYTEERRIGSIRRYANGVCCAFFENSSEFIRHSPSDSCTTMSGHAVESVEIL